MYKVAVRRDFVARHYLVGGDWGAENQLHSHHYQVEVELGGEVLDEYGYLVDIADLEAHLEEVVAYFRDRTLNELPEFAGLNPSIEHFARILWESLRDRLRRRPLKYLQVKVWETGIAWAAFAKEL